MIEPISFPRVTGTTATYMHPLLQSTMMQSARPTDTMTGPAVPRQQPTIPTVTGVTSTAAYASSLERDATSMVSSAKATARLAPEPTTPSADLTRSIMFDRATNQVGMLLTRAASERRVALNSGVPATRLADLNTTTSRLYHALDMLV